MSIALIGAGGKMGNRITDNLMKTDQRMFYVEISEAGIKKIQEKGLSVTPEEEAIAEADVIILAVPDVFIGRIAAYIVPTMKKGAMLVLLDPAAAYLNKLPERPDVSYFIAHPCHPSMFNHEVTEEGQQDYFGGVAAKQAIVCSLMQGPKEDYCIGESIAKQMYAPVTNAHQMTVEQMAILEPTMVETIGAATAMLLREAMDEAVKKGVPEEATRDFMFGHINTIYAVVFGEANGQLSDACIVAAEYGKKYLFKEDWKRLFEEESVREQIDVMLHPERLREVK
ncbi:phosphogluconate dehydrogenase C-terminal domain-containing protein [Bacillus solitudinis]|uniref:phosphogluconate dehydrogenase C-terminal domain-containing protein n=1 Tax=Bacillus solitudinis TaxID=2014074 RepID=UPI000C23F890|nr:phosphogluconate dehydrogenase C-terminal domain-containing protein [Bacillus solitudinis]